MPYSQAQMAKQVTREQAERERQALNRGDQIGDTDRAGQLDDRSLEE